MSVFGNAKKINLKEEALDTKKWMSDEELYSAFFIDDNNIVNELNSLITSFSQSTSQISVSTDYKYNKTMANELKVA